MSVTAAKRFVASGFACGIKPSGKPDLALVATADRRPAVAAGVFTTNLVQAGPVQVSQQHLTDGTAVGVVLNSGNANAATGAQGRADARRMCELAADGLGVAPSDLLVCSTGLIGIPMPMAPIESGIPRLVGALGAGPAAGDAANDGILTTDTVRKQAVATFENSPVGDRATIGGMAKGAAMLSPAMATMLAVLTTDADVDRAALQSALSAAVARSFDHLDIDGSRSTNDTVVVLANGASGGPTITLESGDLYHRFAESLADVCGQLAEMMARDAEGATKFVRIVVRGARSMAEARVAARAVSRSQLVQCSLHGGDPYWGRVLSELGASGVHLDPEGVDIAYNGIAVCRDGVACDHDVAAVAASMQARDIEIVADLRLGHGEATFLTTDLSPAYIDENMRTS
jgi:glutamate N-acetyltransferase / amino-acid N-acetyltransferase